ncbi:hypothetical protein [Desulfofalx alkaliphila]|uniref:hypothetical protein n=1 Tax=Desulfofalx alkaliphila TaxID=105483 RepID=UPI00146FBBEE|nr:hypothetical protein [Desulfofalx alkaliphila]
MAPAQHKNGQVMKPHDHQNAQQDHVKNQFLLPNCADLITVAQSNWLPDTAPAVAKV